MRFVGHRDRGCRVGEASEARRPQKGQYCSLGEMKQLGEGTHGEKPMGRQAGRCRKRSEQGASRTVGSSPIVPTVWEDSSSSCCHMLALASRTTSVMGHGVNHYLLIGSLFCLLLSRQYCFIFFPSNPVRVIIIPTLQMKN